MRLDPEALYHQLGRLVETMPDFAAPGPVPAATQQWLGRAAALVEDIGDLADIATLKVAANHLGSSSSTQQIIAVIHRALARAELLAPISAQGAFIAAGTPFDAFAAVAKILGTVQRGVLIVDPYMDEKALTDFVSVVPEGCAVRLLADQQSHKPSLKPAVARWASQYGAKRPLEARLATAKSLHDRLIVVDGKEAWTLTQSFNALAARSPASIGRADIETAKLKIAAYETMWQAASSI